MKMNLQKVTNVLKNFGGRQGLILKKYSPEILLVVGIGGVVGSAVLACKATLKCEETWAEAQDKFDYIKHTKETFKDQPEKYSEQDYNKDMTVATVQTAVDFIILYGPAVSLGIASIGCIIGSHGIMKKRNVAIMAAYKTVEEAFKAYRKRVQDEYGEEKDYIFRHGITAEEVAEEITDENGKTKKVKSEKLKINPYGLSEYARLFDSDCSEWEKSATHNYARVQCLQNYFNDLLKGRGHVFLNEVYDAFGMKRSKAGQAVGWVLGNGDDYIDFGLCEERSKRFIMGHEATIWLDFNVDGIVWDLL